MKLMVRQEGAIAAVSQSAVGSRVAGRAQVVCLLRQLPTESRAATAPPGMCRELPSPRRVSHGSIPRNIETSKTRCSEDCSSALVIFLLDSEAFVPLCRLRKVPSTPTGLAKTDHLPTFPTRYLAEHIFNTLNRGRQHTRAAPIVASTHSVQELLLRQ